MKTTNHKEITRAAIGERFSERALEVILAANIGQDALRYQVGHDHHHFDNNKFAETDAYIFALRAECVDAIKAGDKTKAWKAFGKITHTVQDFYAHTNFVELNASSKHSVLREPGAELPDGLISGKLYYPLEVITFIPGMPDAVIQMFPEDSHARLNKDDESRPWYQQARELAIGATVVEVGKIIETLSLEEQALFFDNPLN